MKIWLIVTAVMLLRLIGSIFLLARTKARALPASPPLVPHVEEWLARCRSNRKRVRLLISAEISTPMVAGLSQPAILIPAKMLAVLDQGDLSQIGLHEAAHLARRDDYALLFERIIEAVFFLHPAIRWITRQLDLEREIACDDFVVEAGGGSRRYAACLTRVAEVALGVRPSALAVAAIVERSHLVRRVDLLLDKTRHTGTRLLKMRLVTALVAVTACAVMLARVPRLFALPQSQSDWFVPVTVQNAQGRIVAGLGKDAFRLFEDGVEQQISRVSEAGPASIGIILDTSTEIDPNLEHSRMAAEQFLKVSAPGDEFFLVTSGDRSELLREFTSNSGEIRARLSSLHPSAGSAIADSISMALVEMKKARNKRKLLWVFYNGDGYGYYPANADLDSKIAKQVRDSGVEVSSLRDILAQGPGPEALMFQGGRGFVFPGARWVVLPDLSRSADRPWVGVPATKLEEGAAMLAILTRDQYRIEYTPKNATRDGAARRVDVKLAIPEPLSAAFTVVHPKTYQAALICERCPNLPPNW